MGQSFYLSLYDEKQNKYLNVYPFLSKLGELAYAEHSLWGYIKNNPLRVGYIGAENERFAKGEFSDEDGYDHGVASENIMHQSDCAGILEFSSELPAVSWTGYLVNHSRKMYVDVAKYYDISRIKNSCIDPLVVLAASNGAASLFWDGFSENSAYSLLGYWFTDIIEWVDTMPENFNELCSLEFCEFFWKTMLDEWGITDDGYIANKKGEVFYIRKNLALFDTEISPVKTKFKITNTDTHIHCNSEFVPDKDVVLVYGENNSVTFSNPDGSNYSNYKREWYGSAYIKTSDGEVVDIRL